MIDQLKTIGIERGKAFSPDTRTKDILALAVKAAQKYPDLNYESFAPFLKTHTGFCQWSPPAVLKAK